MLELLARRQRLQHRSRNLDSLLDPAMAAADPPAGLMDIAR
jgi:hypothetical protein